jgi:hypothetical protein
MSELTLYNTAQYDLSYEEHGAYQSFFFKYRIAFILFSAFLFLVFSIYAESLAIYPCFILFGCIGCMLSAFQGRIGIKLFTTVYSISSIFAIILFFLFKLQYGLPYQGGGSDGLAYEIHAEKIKNVLFHYDTEEIGQIIDQPYHNSKGYIYFIAQLMKLSDLFGGFHTMIARLFNVNLLALSSVLIYTIAKKISLFRQQAINCALVTGLFPIMIYTAVQSYRDIPVLFILLLSVLLALNFLESRFILKRLFIIGCFYLLILVAMEFRLLNVINIAGMLVVALFIKLAALKRISNLHILFAVGVFFFFSIIILSSELAIFVELINKLDSSGTDLAEGVDRSAEGGLSLILFNLPVPYKYIATVFYSFITPLPIVYAKDLDWNFLSLGTIYQFLFIPFVLAGIKNTFRSRAMLPVFMMLLISYIGYVFGTFTFRHITYVVPFAAIYGTIGYEKYKQHKRVIFSVAGGILFFLIFMYYIIKIIF